MTQSASSKSVWFLKASADENRVQALYSPKHVGVVINDKDDTSIWHARHARSTD